MFTSQTIGRAVVAIVAAGQIVLGAQAPAPSPQQLAIQESTQADHKRMLALLGITELRRGVEGRNTQSPNFANYDEAKVKPYPPLPELMVTKAGARVTTARAWWDVRRPEIVELFDREVYGRMPKDLPKVSWSVASTTEEAVDGVTTVRKVARPSHPRRGRPGSSRSSPRAGATRAFVRPASRPTTAPASRRASSAWSTRASRARRTIGGR